MKKKLRLAFEELEKEMELEGSILSSPMELSAITGGFSVDEGSSVDEILQYYQSLGFIFTKCSDGNYYGSQNITLDTVTVSARKSSTGNSLYNNNSFSQYFWDNINQGGGGGGTGGGGYSNTNSNYNLFQQKFEKVLNYASTANGIQTLNHSAINYLISVSGGTTITEISEVASKTGLGKIALVGVIYDGVKTFIAFSDGDISGEDWGKLGKSVIGGLSYVPGVVGVIATGISFVIMATEE